MGGSCGVLEPFVGWMKWVREVRESEKTPLYHQSLKKDLPAHFMSLERCVTLARPVRVATSLPALPPAQEKLDGVISTRRGVALPLHSLPSTPSSALPRLLANAALKMARTRSKRGEGSAARRKRTTRRSERKIAAASAAATTADPPLATLENFATLPHELRVHIINLACMPTTTSARAGAASGTASSSADQLRPGRPRPHLDTTTILSLMASCQSFYTLLAPKLYNHVWISRPSALASLQLALSSHPDLGSHVKSLYVGPADRLPKHYNPVVMEDDFCWEDEGEVPMLFFTSSLRDDEAKLLPRWCIPDYRWLLDYPGETRPSEAINLALEVAQRTIDVDLGFGTYSKGGAKISEVEHIKRVFEVQAALDHYLMMMRRHEDALGLYEVEDEEDEELPEYPPLVITGYSNSPLLAEQSHGEEQSCTVDRSQLLHHLARPYSTTDRFDHPLVFARSGLETKVLTTWTEEPSRQSRYSGRGAEDWSRIFLSPASSVDYSLPNTASFHSLLDLLRSVLIHTHKLENLALTGFLDLALCGDHQAALFLNHLDSVSIGPFPQRWFQPLDLQRFAGLKELRLAGIRLHYAELDAIIAMFPALRKFQWSMASRFRFDHVPQ